MLLSITCKQCWNFSDSMISCRSDSAFKLFPNASTLFNELAALAGEIPENYTCKSMQKLSSIMSKKHKTVRILMTTVLSSLRVSFLCYSIWEAMLIYSCTADSSTVTHFWALLDIWRGIAGNKTQTEAERPLQCYLYWLCCPLINSSLHLCWCPQQPLDSQPSLAHGYTLFHPAQGWPKCYTGPRW